MSSRKILRSYQRKALRYLMSYDHGALYMEMRLGKTLPILRRSRLLTPLNPRLGVLVLVIGPGSCLDGWFKQGNEEEFDIFDLRGTRRARQQILRDALTYSEMGPRYRLCLLNKEGWSALPEITALQWDTLVLDESVFIKNPRAKVTKFFLKNFRRVPHRYVLTGTPDPEGAQDFWCQLAFLHGGAMGTTKYWDWRLRYMRPHPAGFGWVMKPGATDEVRRYVGERCFILRRSDVQLNEQRIYERRMLMMPPKIRKEYERMEEEFRLDIDGINVTTKFAGKKYQVLRQLASGMVEGQCVWNGKVDELLNLVLGELRNDQVIVWCNYSTEIKVILEALKKKKIRTAKLDGSTPQKKRSSIVDQFQKRRSQVLVVQQAVAQGGMDLSASDTSIYFSSPPGQMARRQTEDRILTVEKAEKKTPLLFIDLVTEDSVDLDVLEALEEKKKHSELTMARALKKAMKERRSWT